MKRLPTTVIVALLALALTATAAFAARAPQQVRPQVEETPVVIGDATPTPVLDGGAAPTAGEDETETPDADESNEPKDADAPGAHPSNHGWTVSQAAHQTTPPGCRNHGQYVSIVARGEYDPFATPAPGATAAQPCPSADPNADKTKNPNADKTPKAGEGKVRGASASHRHTR